MLSIREPNSKAEDLEEEVCSIHLNIRDYSIQIDSKKFKFLVLDLLSNEIDYPQSAEVRQYIAEIKLLTSSSDILLFLKEHGFISFHNYKIFEGIVLLLWKDQIIMSQLNNYIKKYKKFEHQLSLNQISKV